MQKDFNATNFIKTSFNLSSSPTVFCNYTIPEVGEFFVPWDCEQVKELATGSKISEHEWSNKQEKFEKFKKIYLENSHNEITLFAVRSAPNSPILLIDGVHRAVGIYSGYLHDQNIQSKTNIIVVLFESSEINEMSDYKKLTANCK